MLKRNKYTLIVIAVLAVGLAVFLWPLLRDEARFAQATKKFKQAHSAYYDFRFGGEKAYELALEADRLLPDNCPPSFVAPIHQLIFELAYLEGKPSYGKGESWMQLADDPTNPKPYFLTEVSFFEALCSDITDLIDDPDLLESMLNAAFDRLEGETGTRAHLQRLLTFSCQQLATFGDYERVVRIALGRAPQYPDPKLEEVLARSLLKTGNIDQALYYARLSVQKHEETKVRDDPCDNYYFYYSQALRTLGQALLESGNVREAQEIFRKSMTDIPIDYLNPYLIELAHTFLDAGDISAVSECISWMDQVEVDLLDKTANGRERDWIRFHYENRVKPLRSRFQESLQAKTIPEGNPASQ